MRLFDKEVYIQRRKELAAKIGNGVIWIMGNNESAMNYKDNTYPYRQNSNFLYYFGINQSDLNAVIDADTGEAILFGHELTMDDIIWMGEVEKLSSLAEKVGVTNLQSPEKLQSYIQEYISGGRNIHYLPPYRLEHFEIIKNILNIDFNAQKENASIELIKAVIAQRSIKTAIEIAEMEKSVNITKAMHLNAMQSTNPNLHEYEVVSEIVKTCKENNGYPAYGIIFSVRGEVLHNHHHYNLMNDGQLVLNDSGAENDMCYAGDITRTFPVNGKFTQQQKDIYSIVLEMEKESIKLVKPGITYRDIHLNANKILLQRFTELGFLKGNVEDMLTQGVAGLFMPHGLGHMIGLDVHDMEDLGENYVGYEEGQERATYLGLKSLRLARTLQPGFTLTVEPGIYFIPQLIEKYKSENKFVDFVNYEKLIPYYNFGGIRVEDNVLVTSEGYKVLGDYIPKEIEEIETLMSN